MAVNPYAAQEYSDIATQQDYGTQQNAAYAVPDIAEGSPYNDEFGWAGPKSYRASTVETPSAQRLQQFPRIDFRPDPVRPSEEGFYPKRDADEKKRHSVEDIDADGWTELKGIYPSDKRWADNPRRYPPPEDRPTMQMAPRTYLFTRPWLQDVKRNLNGVHFSMADHRRSYEILGMAPATSRRNTYRMEPPPWDVDVVDLPPTNGDPRPSERVRAMEVPAPSRAWRLS